MDATAILVSDWSFSKNLGQINRKINQSETTIVYGGHVW
jgi:hypothetical protein